MTPKAAPPPEKVEIFEVGPRDGLQNEPGLIATADKIALIECLSGAGVSRIEVASFVSPKWVPQMADSAEVLAGISRRPGVQYCALVPNMRGFDRARAAKADAIAVFGSASEGFSRANLNMGIDESLVHFSAILNRARALGWPVRGYVSCVVECPYDGEVDPGAAARMAGRLFALGCHEVVISDTLGRARPEAVEAMVRAVLDQVPASRLAGHFHDTDGRALDNIDVALDHGIRVFDAAAGGLGGCPYAPGAAGNVASESVNDHLLARGFVTGLDRDMLARAAEIAQGMRGKDRPNELGKMK